MAFLRRGSVMRTIPEHSIRPDMASYPDWILILSGPGFGVNIPTFPHIALLFSVACPSRIFARSVAPQARAIFVRRAISSIVPTLPAEADSI